MVTKIDVDQVHFTRSKVTGQIRCISIYKKHIFQTHRTYPLHGDDHGVRYPFHSDKKGLRLDAAVSAVKRPFPHPSSKRSSSACGIRVRHLPRCSSGSRINTPAQRSIRGIKLGFFLILIRLAHLAAIIISNYLNTCNPTKYRL